MDFGTGFEIFKTAAYLIALVAVFIYISRENKKKLDAHDEKFTTHGEKIEKVEKSVEKKVNWEDARKEFVSKELYNNQMKHIDNSLDEIKKMLRDMKGAENGNS